MADIATEVAVVGTAIAGIATAVVVAGYSLGGIRHGAKWAWTLFKGTSR